MQTPDQFTVDTARAAAENDDLAGWVAAFLASPGSDNPELAAALADPPRWWLGPVKLRFTQLSRLAGPPGHPALSPLDEDDLERVDGMQESLQEGWDPPPLIVTHQGDHLLLEDGNHRVECLRQQGASDCWSLVAFEDPAERDRFVERAAAL